MSICIFPEGDLAFRWSLVLRRLPQRERWNPTHEKSIKLVNDPYFHDKNRRILSEAVTNIGAQSRCTD